MTELIKGEVILSIETAVEGGSLSIWANRSEIDGWSGTSEISKAEDVLERIAKLLRVNSIDRNQIKLIGVSKDVGSLTGRKIGLALAKGLTKSLKCDLVEISVLEALLTEIKGNFEGECITAVTGGRDNIWWQIFDIRNDIFFEKAATPEICSADEFCKILGRINFRKLVFSSDVAKKNPQIFDALVNIRQEKYNISKMSLASNIARATQ